MDATALFDQQSLRGLVVLLDATVKGVVILIAAGMIHLALRRGSAAVRHAVWAVAVAILLCVPVLSIALPQWRLSVLPAWLGAMVESPPAHQPEAVSSTPAPAAPRKTEAAVEPPAVADVRTPDYPVEPVGPDQAAPPPMIGQASTRPDYASAGPVPTRPVAAPVARDPEEPVKNPPTAAATQTPPTQTRSWTVQWPRWLLLAWACGLLIMAAPLLVGVVAIGRRVRRATPVSDEGWLSLLRTLGGQLSIRRPLRLLFSAECQVPMTWGLFRPAILLPPGFGDWPDERRRVVLLHELAHVRRGDCLTQLLARLVRAIYWFNPLVWLAAHVLRIERERACDDLVLSAGQFKASDYAGHLLEIVRSLRRRPGLASMAAVAMARRSQFEGRLLAILDGHRSRRTLTRLGLLAIALLISALAVPVSMMRATAGPAGISRSSDALEREGPAATTQPAASPVPPATQGDQRRWGPVNNGLQMSAWLGKGGAEIHCLIRNASDKDIRYSEYFLGYRETVFVQARRAAADKWQTIPRHWPGGDKSAGPSSGYRRVLSAGRQMPPAAESVKPGFDFGKAETTFLVDLTDFQWPSDWRGEVTLRVLQKLEDSSTDTWIGTLESAAITVPLASIRSAVATQPDARPAPPAMQGDAPWGEPVKGIAARVVLDRPTFKLGEPVVVTFELKLASPEGKLPPGVAFRDALVLERGTSFAAFQEQGKPVEVKPVRVGEVFFRARVNLADMNPDMSAPWLNQDYSVRLKYSPLNVRSQPVNLRVDTDLPALDDYVRKLVQRQGDHPLDQVARIPIFDLLDNPEPYLSHISAERPVSIPVRQDTGYYYGRRVALRQLAGGKRVEYVPSDRFKNEPFVIGFQAGYKATMAAGLPVAPPVTTQGDLVQARRGDVGDAAVRRLATALTAAAPDGWVVEPVEQGEVAPWFWPPGRGVHLNVLPKPDPQDNDGKPRGVHIWVMNAFYAAKPPMVDPSYRTRPDGAWTLDNWALARIRHRVLVVDAGVPAVGWREYDKAIKTVLRATEPASGEADPQEAPATQPEAGGLRIELRFTPDRSAIEVTLTNTSHRELVVNAANLRVESEGDAAVRLPPYPKPFRPIASVALPPGRSVIVLTWRFENGYADNASYVEIGDWDRYGKWRYVKPGVYRLHAYYSVREWAVVAPGGEDMWAGSIRGDPVEFRTVRKDVEMPGGWRMVGVMAVEPILPAAPPPATQREIRLTSPPKTFVASEQIELQAAALRVLRDPKAKVKELDAAMQAMNPWPSTPEQVNALAAVALNRPRGDRVAGNAASHLAQAHWSIPGPLRSEIRAQFREAVAKEDEPARVEGMLWALAEWGEPDWVWEKFGKTLPDETLKVWILIHLPERKAAVNELLAMIDRARPKTDLMGWQHRNDFAEALVMTGDKHGVDIDIELLTLGQTFLPKIGYHTTLPSKLRWLSLSLGYDFTKDEAGKSRTPSAALEALTAWWKANRETWAMDPPDKLPADKPLNARQARRLAARLANEAFAKVTFKTPAGVPIGEATISSEESQARLEDDEWFWSGGAPRGPRATVTFDARGGDAKVSIDYVFGDEPPYPPAPPEAPM